MADFSVARNLRYSYGPLNESLTRRIAPAVPRFLSPNAITLLSTAMLAPVLWCLHTRLFVLAALLVVLHDMADRLDGAVARFRRDPAHDGRLGAFLDAQGDKVRISLCSLSRFVFAYSVFGRCFTLAFSWATWQSIVCPWLTPRLPSP